MFLTFDKMYFPKEKPITVGWGKRETQFHGSVGKPTAASLQQVVSLYDGLIKVPEIRNADVK